MLFEFIAGVVQGPARSRASQGMKVFEIAGGFVRGE
jgi:hypothetical protein